MPPLRLQVVQKKNNSMTLLIAPHPSSPVSGTQDKPFSPHSRRSGAKLSEGHPASPLSLTWYIVFKIHVVLSLVFIAQRPRHLYLIAPKPLLGWEYWKLTLQTPQHSLFLHPKRIVFVAVKNVRFFFISVQRTWGFLSTSKIKKFFFFFLNIYSNDLYPGLPVWKIRKTKMEHTCPDCDVWSVAMTMHPIISPTTS